MNKRVGEKSVSSDKLNMNKNVKIGIVVARFNEFIGERLLKGAMKALKDHKVLEKNVKIIKVPGAFEIPLAAQTLIEKYKPDVVVTLGAVIRGETWHFEYVCRECVSGIQSVILKTGVPVIFEVLMVEDVEQALKRSGAKAEENKGYQGVVAGLEMVKLLLDI